MRTKKVHTIPSLIHAWMVNPQAELTIKSRFLQAEGGALWVRDHNDERWCIATRQGNTILVDRWSAIPHRSYGWFIARHARSLCSAVSLLLGVKLKIYSVDGVLPWAGPRVNIRKALRFDHEQAIAHKRNQHMSYRWYWNPRSLPSLLAELASTDEAFTKETGIKVDSSKQLRELCQESIAFHRLTGQRNQH